MSNRDFLGSLTVALLSLAVSAILLVTLYVWLLPSFDESFASARNGQAGEPLQLSGNAFRPRISGGSVLEGPDLVITGLKNGEAILLNERRFDAADYQFLHVDSEGLQPGLKLFVFWQTVEQPGGVFYAEVPLEPGGEGWFNLTKRDVWKGTVRKIEVGIFGDLRGGAFRLHEVSLHPYGAAAVLGTIWTEWRHFKSWDQSSINAHYVKAPGPMLFQVLALTIWVLTAALLYLMASALPVTANWLSVLLGTHASHSRRAVFIMLLCLGWLPLSGLWIAELWLQNHESRIQFSGKTLHEKKLSDWDGPLYALAHETQMAIGNTADRISVLATGDFDSIPTLGRLRYHLLPELKAIFMGRLTSDNILRAAEQQYVLVLTNNAKSFAETAVNGMRKILHKDPRFANAELEVLFVSAQGVLLRR